MRLRTYLALLVTAAILPVLVFSTVSLKKMQESQRTAALNSIKETARATALNIDREINGAKFALRMLAASKDLAGGDFKGFYEKAKLANLAPEGWIILFDESGQQIINTRLSYGARLPKRSPDLGDLNEVMQGDLFVSGVVWGNHSKRHLVLVELPVTVGKKTYVVSQALPASYFDRAFKGQDIPQSWIIGIFDKSGITLARSHRASELVGTKAKADTLEAIGKAYSGVLRHTIRGDIEVYDVFTRSAMSDWSIAIGAPVEEIESSIGQAGWLHSLGLLVAFLVASAVAWTISTRITRSMAEAVQAAEAIGRGQEMPKPSEGDVQEFRVLHTALSNTSAELDLAKKQLNASLRGEQQARKLAEEQNRAKDQFLAMLGHELRNPLAAITGAVDLVNLGGNGAHFSRAIAVISRQSDHLTHIVNDLLDVSRVLSGKVLLDREKLNLAEIVRECVGTMQSTGRASGLALRLSADAPVWVNADATRLDQMINNLLDNAIKYTPKGGSIEVEVGATESEAVLTVRDTGVGIPPDLLPNIFDVFVQGERSLDRAQGGLGIGLSLVRRLAELHGGSVRCESKGVGAGSTFRLFLPRTEPAVPENKSATDETGNKDCTVLIIDDHADARDMTSAMLQKHGFTVVTAEHALQGIDIARAVKPDVALIDIGMPEIDGYELARRLRALKDLDRTKLVALTGYGGEEDTRKSLAAGFDMHMVKPLSIAGFMKALEELCRNKDD